MTHPVHVACWFELPVSDMQRARSFYEAVLKTTLHENNEGPNPMMDFPTAAPGGVSGHLYPGKPPARGTGPTVHIVVPDKLEAAMARVPEAGGEVVSPVIDIPPGRFAHCLDPDGNSIGLFEARG